MSPVWIPLLLLPEKHLPVDYSFQTYSCVKLVHAFFSQLLPSWQVSTMICVPRSLFFCWCPLCGLPCLEHGKVVSLHYKISGPQTLLGYLHTSLVSTWLHDIIFKIQMELCYYIRSSLISTSWVSWWF